MYRFDEAQSTFVFMSLLEGHVREITSLLLVGDPPFLWSSSADHSIRVWDMTTGKCIGSLAHNEVSSLQKSARENERMID
jgi:WD40 repeat protein